MKRFASILALAATANLAAADGTPRISRIDEVGRNATGCVTTPIACDSSATGSLGLGDCTFSDGTYYDRYTFTGIAGQIIDIEVRPLSPSLTNPMIVLAPPIGDASKTPIIRGGAGTEVIYKLSSSGVWAIGVGTADLFASGKYLVHLSCLSDDDPGGAQNCVSQYVICGQSADWSLTAQSCRFTSDPTYGYQPFELYGLAGDLVTFTESSIDFVPLAGVLRESTNQYIGSTTTSTFASKVSALLPANGWYRLVVASVAPQKAGAFHLDLQCVGSGCLGPIFTSQPPPITKVPYGKGASVTISASAYPTATVGWQETFPDQGVPLSSGLTLFLGSVQSRVSAVAIATNVCGSDVSNEVTILPASASRPRAVKH